MLAFLGTAGLVVALIGASLLVWRGVAASRSFVAPDLIGPAKLMLAGSVAAMGAMEIALLTDDFSLADVANNHASTTPFPFNVATAWAALEAPSFFGGWSWPCSRGPLPDATADLLTDWVPPPLP